MRTVQHISHMKNRHMIQHLKIVVGFILGELDSFDTDNFTLHVLVPLIQHQIYLFFESPTITVFQ